MGVDVKVAGAVASGQAVLEKFDGILRLIIPPFPVERYKNKKNNKFFGNSEKKLTKKFEKTKGFSRNNLGKNLSEKIIGKILSEKSDQSPFKRKI